MTAVEVLTSGDVSRLRRAVGRVQNTHFAARPSSGEVERLLVAWLSDLDRVEARRAFEDLVDVVATRPGAAEVVLIQMKAEPAPSVAAAQLIAHVASSTEHEPYIAPDSDVLRRMLLARQARAEGSLVASASVEGDRLIVWSCEPRRYEITLSQLPALEQLEPEARTRLSVSTSGSRIHWDDGDIDLTLDAVRAHSDPAVRSEHDAKLREDAARYADAIRCLREEHGLRQTDITGLTARQLRRLEDGGTIPQMATLRKLADAHGLTIDEYLAELAKRSRHRRTTRVRSPTKTGRKGKQPRRRSP